MSTRALQGRDAFIIRHRQIDGVFFPHLAQAWARPSPNRAQAAESATRIRSAASGLTADRDLLRLVNPDVVEMRLPAGFIQSPDPVLRVQSPAQLHPGTTLSIQAQGLSYVFGFDARGRATDLTLSYDRRAQVVTARLVDGIHTLVIATRA